jgi:hypothetical protein
MPTFLNQKGPVPPPKLSFAARSTGWADNFFRHCIFIDAQ